MRYLKAVRPTALIALLLVVVISAACATSSNQSPSDSTAAPVSTPVLTPDEIHRLARSAVKSFVTVRSEGEFLVYEADGIEDPESATVVEEWTAPNRSRQTTWQDQGDGIVESQLVVIGDRGYILGGFGDSTEWREVTITRSFEPESGPDSTGTQEPLNDLENRSAIGLDIDFEDTVATVELNGATVYRISGSEVIAEGDPRLSNGQEASGQVVLFIDPSSFLLLREERTMTIKSVREVEDVNSPDGIREDVEETTFELWYDFIYSNEPLVIERPESFIPNGGFDDSPPHTPTPFVPPSTPTPTTAPATSG